MFNELFEMTKIINSKYNEYINNEVENKLDNEESDSIKESNQSSQTIYSDSNTEITNNRTFSNLNDLNDFFWYNTIESSNKFLKIDNEKRIFPIIDPLEAYSSKLLKIIKKYGLGSINDTILYFLGKEKNTLFSWNI